MLPLSARDHLRSEAHRWLVGLLLSAVLLAPSVSLAQTCIGDCNANGVVSVDELIRGVNIALATQSVDGCANMDRSGDGVLTVDELIAAVGVALNGCPPAAFTSMTFQRETIVKSHLPVPVTLDGTLNVSSDGGQVAGQLVATYGSAGSGTIVAGSDGSFVIHVGENQVDLLPNDSDSVAINGAPISLEDLFAAFDSDVASGMSPEQWSVAGQATLALLALGSTQAWTSNVSAAVLLSGSPSTGVTASLRPKGLLRRLWPGWCKFTCLTVARVIQFTFGAATAAACVVAVTSACAAAGGVTFGTLFIPCISLEALCAAIPGTMYILAYELAISLWEPTTPRPTPTPAATVTETRTAPIPTRTRTPMPALFPTGVRATAGDGQVILRWNSVSGATSYNVYVATVSGVNATNYDTLPGGTRYLAVSSPFMDTGLTNGTRYYFVVTAVNDAGESEPSAEVFATPRARSGDGQSSIASNGNARFTCVLLATGEVSCWGGFPGCQVGGGCLPTLISEISTATMVTAGDGFACVLLADGTVQCWGNNVHHVLGVDGPASSVSPVMINGIADAIVVDAGAAHVCAIVSGGTVECWGDNYRGQLGNGTVGGDSAAPVTVSGVSGATAVAAGYWHTCAVVGGGVRCWGYNIAGQLGESTSLDDPECFRSCPPSATPLEVRDIFSAAAVSVGTNHSCAVLADGSLVCWGQTGLFIDDPLNYSPVTPREVDGISSATLVSAGYTHTCADSDGALYCWGYGNAGELGNGANGSFANRPVMVRNLSGASAVATGYVHTCAVTGETVQCWGSNLSRMLGVGQQNDPYFSNVPVIVTEISDAR